MTAEDQIMFGTIIAVLIVMFVFGLGDFVGLL